MLYDTIGTIAETLEEDINEEPYKSLLITPLLQKWQTLNDNDTDLFPLLECLSYITLAMGPNFISYTQPIFDRSVRLIEMVLRGTSLHYQDTRHELPSREFLICSLDMISALCEAIKDQITPFVSNPIFLQLLLTVCSDPAPDYGQSVLALVGDIAQYAISALNSIFPNLMPILLNSASSRFFETSNNAIWAIGEIIAKVPGQVITPYAEKIYEVVVSVILTNTDYRILGTSAVTLGRLAGNHTNLIAKNLRQLFPVLCNSIKHLDDDREKFDTLRGICVAVQMNPADIYDEFDTLCDTITSLYCTPIDLQNMFRFLLQSFKNSMSPEDWNEKMDSLRPSTRDSLLKNYKI